jgi:glycosyltransferase involved in cell wall biosynthesis
MTQRLVTVAICTWNRAPLLDRVLSHLPKLHIPAQTDWELLIVDNNSTDHTAEVAAKHAAQLPIRYVREREPGISYARNRGIAEARGEIILWTDDDAFPEPDWLAYSLKALDDFSADMVFGRVEPIWQDGQPPRWYTEKFAGMFALIDLGGETRVLDCDPILGFNVNMAFRKSIIDRIGPYRTDIGCGRMAGGEDVDMFLRAKQASLRIAYQPYALVRHFIPRSRCTKRFYRRYTWGGSPNHLLLLRDEAKRVPRLLGLPRYFVRQQLSYLSGWLKGLFTRDDGQAFYCELKLLRLAGLYWAMFRHVDPRTITERAGE